MKLEGLVPCCRESATGLCPAAVQSSPHTHTLLFHPPIYSYVYQVTSSLQIFRLKCCMFLRIPYARYMSANLILHL